MNVYLHNVPGRLRVKIPSIKHMNYKARKVESLFEFREGIERVRANALTGSLTINYDPERVSVDQLLADLDASEAGAGEPELRHEPPKLILSTEPALLVSMDGKPVFEAIERSNYERVVNTPFLIVKDGRTHYLYIGSNAWYTATAIDGPWDRTEQVPQDIAGLVEPSDDDDTLVDDVRIIVATEPTELIVSDGDPTWSPVEGMDLLYMDNTDSDAFLELSTQRYYVLLSGRWYRGEGMLGNLRWSHVPNDELPEPFSDIPAK